MASNIVVGLYFYKLAIDCINIHLCVVLLYTGSKASSLYVNSGVVAI